MIFTRKNSRLEKEAVKKARSLMDARMPRNTNFNSFAARQRIAEIIVEMMFSSFIIESKIKNRLRRLRNKNKK